MNENTTKPNFTIPDLPPSKHRFEVSITPTGERLDYTATQMKEFYLKGCQDTLNSNNELMEKLDKYLKANYPDSEGTDIAERSISALEKMDIALGMKNVPKEKNTKPIIRWYMTDNHIFLRLSDNDDEAIVRVKASIEQGFTYGLLCATQGNNKPFGSVSAEGKDEIESFLVKAKKWLSETHNTEPSE